MKKSTSKKIIASVLCAAAFGMSAMAANPGSSDDPLITLSYVNDVLIPQMKSYVDASVGSASEGVGNAPVAGGTSASYNIVNVSKGQTVIGGKSCQMIMRMGKGTIVASAKGGIADVTVGTDLADGTQAPSNHLLIVPLDDGRGIEMETDGILMISGSYSVKQ